MKGWIYLLKKFCIVQFILFLSFSSFSFIKTCDADSEPSLMVGGDFYYSNIQEAINNASEGSTIQVFSGTYYENLVVNKSINLIGSDKNNTIIDGSDNLYTILVKNNRVNISGFTIKVAKVGVYISEPNSNNILIEDNIISDSDEGIHVYNSTDIRISNNDFIIHSAVGINLWNSSNNHIYNNYFLKNKKSIFLSRWSNNNSILDNNITKSGIGIGLDYSFSNFIQNNTISKCENGIRLSYSDLNNITSNSINNCYSYGIYFSNSKDNILEPNEFLDNRQDIKEESKPPVIKAPGFEFIILLVAMILLCVNKKKNFI